MVATGETHRECGTKLFEYVRREDAAATRDLDAAEAALSRCVQKQVGTLARALSAVQCCDGVR
jgi:hypothetical protein